MHYKNNVESFVSKFCQVAESRGYPERSRRKLPKLLNRIILEELPVRDSKTLIQFRELKESSGLSCFLYSCDAWVIPKKRDALLCAVTLPDWRWGWSNKIVKDDALQDLISWFFHFASQYVARSKAVSAQGAIALVYGRSCGFRTGTFRQESYCHSTLPDRLSNLSGGYRFAHVNFEDEWRTKGRERALAAWFDLINGLDPYIHRAIFQYLKALRLMEHHFYEEAITSLDNLASVASQFVRDRLRNLNDDRREALSQSLALSDTERTNVRNLREMRLFFGAHPAQNKWWDFIEIYEEDVDKSFETASKLIWKLCHAEVNNRLIERHPDKWSTWFESNAVMLFDAVWVTPV